MFFNIENKVLSYDVTESLIRRYLTFNKWIGGRFKHPVEKKKAFVCKNMPIFRSFTFIKQIYKSLSLGFKNGHLP